MKTNEEILHEKNITPLTKHHSYDYLYSQFNDAMKQSQIEAIDEIMKGVHETSFMWKRVYDVLRKINNENNP